ncbi:MAG TPA: cellulase family glycosylhydrolase [Cellvibrio sp.]|nr:cellulase family glycosylhydrolase [Cellvibrio sp.]
MKNKMTLIALLSSASMLYGCGGGSMLGSSDAEDHKLVPDVVTEDPNPQRPTAGLPVMRAQGDQILFQGQPVSLHGINLQYGDDPLGRYPGIKAISEAGSTIIRLVIKPTTSTNDLEAALNAAISNKLVVILSLADPALACTDDETQFSSAVQATWLKAFLPIIHRDQYQNNLMINIASAWGPKDIFNGYSTGYKTYIDNYKTAIRAFRKAGFQVPLVIDAPCGTDYYAFASDRGKELLAADDEKNLVLSVHGYGAYWNSNSKIDTALSVLQSQKMPFILSEFGGSGVGDKPVKHKQIIEKAAGDYAPNVSIPWKDPSDKVAYIVPLDAPVDVTNTDISFDVWFDKAYVDNGKLGFQMYLRDENGEYANIAWNDMSKTTPGAWNTFKGVVRNKGSFGWASDNFNIQRVTKVGLELIANGKPAEVVGDIKFDNFKIVEGSGAKELFSGDFTSSIAGWETAWEGTLVALVPGEGVGLTRAQGKDQVVAIYKGITGVDFTKPIQIKANIYFPAGYQGSVGTYLKFFNNEISWVTSTETNTISYGAWNEINLTADFGSAGASFSSLGIQIGNLAAGATANPDFYGAIVIKDLTISGIATNNSFAPGTIYSGTFESGEDNWAVMSWGDSGDAIAADGSLNITAKVANADRIDVQHKDPAKIEGLNFKDPFTFKTRIFIPEYYRNLTTLNAQFYLQDAKWQHHFNVFDLSHDKLKIGEWNDIEVKVTFPEGFVREAPPKHMGFSFSTSLDSKVQGAAMSTTDAIKVDDLIFEGLVPVEKEEVVLGLVDFFQPEHFENLAVDFTQGVIVPEDLAARTKVDLRSPSFNWLAWSWYGNSAENAALDMTKAVADPAALTERGEDIVNGKGGLRYYNPVPVK